MTLTTFVPGINTSFSTELNANFIEAYNIGALNLIRQLQDRTVTFSKGMFDWWGDAYTAAAGRMSSVTTTRTITTALFTTNKYIPGYGTDEASGDTTHNPDSATNPSNFFDSDDSTYASISVGLSSPGPTLKYLGKTFASRFVGPVRVKATAVCSGGGSGTQAHVKLETYDGATWGNTVILASGASTSGTSTASYDDVYILNATVQGIRVMAYNGPTTGGTQLFYTLEYGDYEATEIVQTIPTGTFATTISSAILVPHIADWETGADIQYKLTNASEDTGWLDCANTPEISTFTAFTLEPTTLTVKLIPKSSSPTSGYPAIYGFAVKAV